MNFSVNLFITLSIAQRRLSRRIPFLSRKPPPAPKPSIEDSPLIPEANANFLSVVTFQWITPLLSLGYARPLEPSDLYKLQDYRSAERIASLINESFDRRVEEAAEYNARLARGDISPGLKGLWWTIRGNRQEREKKWRQVDGRKKASLFWAINDSVKWWFWSAGILKVIGDTAQVTSPLLVKVVAVEPECISELLTIIHPGNHQFCYRVLCWSSFWHYPNTFCG